MLKARIDMDFTRTESVSVYRKCSAVALVIALVFVYVSLSDVPSETAYKAPISAQISERGSLTSCIENADVASEIEITGSSMKKAIRRVSGWVPKGMANDDDGDDYCALTLA